MEWSFLLGVNNKALCVVLYGKSIDFSYCYIDNELRDLMRIDGSFIGKLGRY